MDNLHHKLTKVKENSIIITTNGVKQTVSLPEFGEVVIKIQNKVPVTSFTTVREDLTRQTKQNTAD